MIRHAKKDQEKVRRKEETKKRKDDEKVARSAERANAKRKRENDRKRSTCASLRLLSQSSTSNDELEANEISVANSSDENNNVTPAPPTISD